MAAAEGTAPATIALWRVRIDDRADLTFHLRDYFRRLGVAAEVATPTEVELETHLHGAELGKLLADWMRVLDVSARFVDRPARAAADTPTPRLGTLLTAKGFITDDQLEFALNESRETGEMLGLLLIRKQWIFEEELARTLSEQLAVPYVSVGRIGVNPKVAMLLPRGVGEAIAAIPVREGPAAVQVAFADPTSQRALDEVAKYVDPIRVAVAELSDIRVAWRSVPAAV